MATDLSAIKALNDFPETPYEAEASQNVLEFRWIHGQCFQFRLPDGKVLMSLKELAMTDQYNAAKSERITAESTFTIRNNAYNLGQQHNAVCVT